MLPMRTWARSLSDRTKARLVMAFTLLFFLFSVARSPNAARSALLGHRSHDSDSVGILLMLHGCSHVGKDWWELPEENRIVAMAKTWGLIPIAPTSLDRESGCWDVHEVDGNIDIPHVQELIEQTKRQSSRDLPVYVIGASSGGTFASILTMNGGFAGSLVMISPGYHSAWVSKQPPTAFLYMSGDNWATKEKVHAASEALKSKGVRTVEFEVSKRPLTVEFLQERLPELDSTAASALLSELVAASHVSGKGEMKTNPRRYCLSLDKPEKFLRRLCEVLNLAYAEHELTSDYFEQVLEFWQVPRKK